MRQIKSEVDGRGLSITRGHSQWSMARLLRQLQRCRDARLPGFRCCGTHIFPPPPPKKTQCWQEPRGKFTTAMELAPARGHTCDARNKGEQIIRTYSDHFREAPH